MRKMSTGAMAMRYVLGVDGGPAGVAAAIMDEEGWMLGYGQGSRVNSIDFADSAGRLERSLKEAVTLALSRADLQNARIAAACLGSQSEARAMYADCASSLPAEHRFLAKNTQIALYSVTLGQPGIVTLGGSHVAAFGKNKGGEQAESGGWKIPPGEEGSDGWVALRALQSCCRAADGIEAHTALLPLLCSRLESETLQELCERYSEEERLSPVIIEVVGYAAAHGDATARRLLREAGRDLAAHACSVLQKLEMQQDAVTVGVAGGIFQAGRSALRAFRERVLQFAPKAGITPPLAPLAVGACLAAWESLGMNNLADIRQNLQESMKHFGPLPI